MLDTGGSFHALFGNASKLGVDLSAVEAVMIKDPYGDMTLPESKIKVGDETRLMGYIELKDLETCTPEEVNKKVKEAIEQGAP